jgi:peptide/nickel transport system ATP-binding protein
MSSTASAPTLVVDELQISFAMYSGGFRRASLEVIHGLSLSVKAGELVAIVGSSGSGKSLLAHAILGILPKNATIGGSICYQGEELTPLRKRELRGKRIALIPQSVDFLDPLMRVGRQVIGVLGTKERQKEAFLRYGLNKHVDRLYPFQLSGGMARRILISTAVITDANLIIADEPTPGLGLDLAEETMRHFREFADAGAGVLLITHDIGLAFSTADRIAVFYAGATVEIADASDFRAGEDALRHPYSRAFIDALPQNGFRPIPGAQPYAGALPSGCLFAARCPLKTEECEAGPVPMRPLRGGEVRCIHAK